MAESNHSAEWLRGARSVAAVIYGPAVSGKYDIALAEAEAREALQGSKEKMALSRIYETASRQLAEPAGAGDAAAMAKICTEVEAVQLGAGEIPTAAEVIRAMREALDGMPFSVHVRACREALALAAEWEGQG